MTLKIIEERENPLFKRKEIKISMGAEISPTNADILKLVSERFSTPEENIKIMKIGGKFGSKNFIISAHIYSSKEEKEKTEIMPKGKTKKSVAKQPEKKD